MEGLTDADVLKLLGGDHPLNNLRKEITYGVAKIDRYKAQTRYCPIQARRMEFELAQRIAYSLGVPINV